MIDSHKIVYVISFMPSFEGSTVGGFDWYTGEDDARQQMVEHLNNDSGRAWSHDYTLRSIPVPKDLNNEQITELLDTELVELRELPLPAEWEAIRGEGGAFEVGD
jgi:hypothetical protein